MKHIKVIRYIISTILMFAAVFAGILLNIEDVKFTSIGTSTSIWITIFGCILQLFWVGLEMSLTDTREAKLKVELKEKNLGVSRDILIDENGHRINSYTWEYIEYEDGYRLIQYNHDISSNLQNGTFSFPVTINDKPVICIDMSIIQQIANA